MGERLIGIDLGATKTNIGIVQDSKVIKKYEFPTSSQAPKQQIIQELIDGITKISDLDFSGIGIGVPGLVDEEKGVIYDLWNIPSWKEVHLKEELEGHFKKKVRITNDANVFALGEKTYGDAKSFQNVVGVTLGSGFGVGIIINNELYSGAFSSAGEFGSVPYLDKTVEDYCSGKFFLNTHGLEGKEVFARAQENDPRAINILHDYGAHLGNALKIILKALSPEAILLGGSITKSFDFYEEALIRSLESFPFTRVRDQLVIKPSTTSNISLLGAAALIKTVHPFVEA